ncbi:MAG: hypothetical protein WBH47_11440, partial [Streptosporangiaceae bacterium]
MTWSRRSWLVRVPVLRYWHESFTRLRWPPRILGWLVTGGLASLAGWRYIPVGPITFEIAYMISVAADARRTRGRPGPVAVDARHPE